MMSKWNFVYLESYTVVNGLSIFVFVAGDRDLEGQILPCRFREIL